MVGGCSVSCGEQTMSQPYIVAIMYSSYVTVCHLMIQFQDQMDGIQPSTKDARGYSNRKLHVINISIPQQSFVFLAGLCVTAYHGDAAIRYGQECAEWKHVRLHTQSQLHDQ